MLGVGTSRDCSVRFFTTTIINGHGWQIVLSLQSWFQFNSSFLVYWNNTIPFVFTVYVRPANVSYILDLVGKSMLYKSVIHVSTLLLQHDKYRNYRKRAGTFHNMMLIKIWQGPVVYFSSKYESLNEQMTGKLYPVDSDDLANLMFVLGTQTAAASRDYSSKYPVVWASCKTSSCW